MSCVAPVLASCLKFFNKKLHFRNSELLFHPMKKIVPPVIALLLSLHAHAAVQTVKFVDVNGKEPQEESHDQYCYLVNCADNTPIPDNNVKLAVGDQLVIQTTETHGLYSYFKTYHYCINDGSSAAVVGLKAIQSQDLGSDNNTFVNFHFEAVASGEDSFDISFADPIFQAPFCYTPNHLLGHVTVTVVE